MFTTDAPDHNPYHFQGVIKPGNVISSAITLGSSHGALRVSPQDPKLYRVVLRWIMFMLLERFFALH